MITEPQTSEVMFLRCGSTSVLRVADSSVLASDTALPQDRAIVLLGRAFCLRDVDLVFPVEVARRSAILGRG